MCSVLQMYRSQHLDGFKQSVTLIIIYATSLRKNKTKKKTPSSQVKIYDILPYVHCL